MLSAHCGTSDSAAKPAGGAFAIHGIEGDAGHLRLRDPAVRNRDVFKAANRFRAELDRMTAAR